MSMSDLRFDVGTSVMCNLGPDGFKPGRIIALHYREDHWPPGKEAPYQVALEGDDDDVALIYVPADDNCFCRKVTSEDLKIAHRADALAAFPTSFAGLLPEGAEELKTSSPHNTGLGCTAVAIGDSVGYRAGRCHCCQCHPQSWSCVELYSEHYCCAIRNGLKVTQRAIDLGTVRVGHFLDHPPQVDLPSKTGFMQRPTLVRLPPGVRFSDDGSLRGQVRFDPHRDATYRVEFVAVSTADWDQAAIGLVRLEITFVVEGNELAGFDANAFKLTQQQASRTAASIYEKLCNTWELWERQELGHRDTCDQMCAHLYQLRALLELHPRLEDGMWWAHLGGFYMNVHKLLENTLYECELYLGHALTFGNALVRQRAECNLEGCYQKRLLEAARFLWIDGVKQMMRSEWAAAAETFQMAAAKKDGWGWAVNHGDIWISESAARLIYGAELQMIGAGGHITGKRMLEGNESAVSSCIAHVEQLMEKHQTRCKESGNFSSLGHPWGSEVAAALESYRKLQETKPSEMADWLEAFKKRTFFWCAQVLGGANPFPPRPKPRLEDAATLFKRLPTHNEPYDT